MNFIIVFIIIHGNTIHNAVVDGIFSVLQKCFLSFGTTERSGLYKSGLSLKYR